MSSSSRRSADARDRGAKALETFAFRYRESDSQYERFQVHKTIFPADFLADFGFQTLRRSGRVELARLEFGGLHGPDRPVDLRLCNYRSS